MHAVPKLNHLNNSGTTTLYSEYSLGLGQTSNFSWDQPNLVSYKFMKSSTFCSVGCVRLNKIQSSNLSIRLLRTERTSEDRLRDKRRTSHATNYFGRKFITDLIQLIGSTRSKFYIWTNRRSWLNLSRHKLEFGLSQERFDVRPRTFKVMLHGAIRKDDF